ncbi:ClpXP protease specificity-enhancing factor SspB [Hyphomicrobium sp. LHD-15]|uniref:SspB family protein n=1 Tax=Hyphomicrobium sp. LHD-15 TaxID=3072142 RepID=UPI00280DE299|nr:ClpXP protease specificity-enhancing factor SspB [Hyphomicrobium sp. LHD-15]MDQ8697933.1 ClpXP protease specificity-enhancing factor SspB [Hyphomicrobium sp. LHD-15]
MTVESTIDYEGLAQEAMRGVVRKVIANTAKSGLAGDHHFYISFDTEAPGVSLSKRLKEKYPREMTIVLQHRFWDLSVTEDRFEVKLTFDGIPERLVVPFAAIKVFFDPSVRFGLQFEDPNASPEARSQSGAASFDPLAQRATRSSHTRKATRSPRKSQSADDSAEKSANAGEEAVTQPPVETSTAANASPPAPTPLSAAKSTTKRQETAEDAEPASGDEEAPAKSGGAEIVSLDKFRKK